MLDFKINVKIIRVLRFVWSRRSLCIFWGGMILVLVESLVRVSVFDD